MSKDLIPHNDEQRARFNRLDEGIRKNTLGMQEWHKCFFELHDSGLWRAYARSFSAFAAERYGYSQRRMQQILREDRLDAARALLRATTNEAIDVEATTHSEIDSPKKTSAHQVKEHLSLPAPKPDPLPEQSETPPVTEPKDPNLPPLPADWRTLILTHWRHVEHLCNRQDLTFDTMKEVMVVASEARKLHELAQSVLPGMEAVAGGKKIFKRPTLEEVHAFAKQTGNICSDDAESFWYKMEGQGWKVNGKPIESWMRVLTYWNRVGYLPSQQQKGQQYGKTNGTGDNRSLLAKEVDRTTAAIQREFGAPRRLSDC